MEYIAISIIRNVGFSAKLIFLVLERVSKGLPHFSCFPSVDPILFRLETNSSEAIWNDTITTTTRTSSYRRRRRRRRRWWRTGFNLKLDERVGISMYKMRMLNFSHPFWPKPSSPFLRCASWQTRTVDTRSKRWTTLRLTFRREKSASLISKHGK